MEVTLGNADINNQDVVLDIIFWKTAPGERRIANGKKLIDTHCRISRVMYADKPATSIIETIAFQNPLDNYNKIIGKKVALAKAVADIDFLKRITQYNKLLQRFSSEEIRSMNLKRRLMRQHIWNIFHQTFRRWN